MKYVEVKKRLIADWCIECGQAAVSIGGIGCTCPPSEPPRKIVRNTSTPESRAFWAGVKRAARRAPNESEEQKP